MHDSYVETLLEPRAVHNDLIQNLKVGNILFLFFELKMETIYLFIYK